MAQTIQKRAAIYIRVSTREQAETGYSVGEQEDRLRKYVEAMDMKLEGVYVDPGFSGASLDRPALQRMLSDIDNGKVDAVVCWKLDRLSRSQKDTLYLIEDRMQSKGVAFISTIESFDTSTPFGKAVVGILSVFAQLEREQIRERMQMGLDARAKQGLWHGGGFDPFGYEYKDGQLTVIPEEAECVRYVYDAYVVQRLPITQILKRVSERWTTRYGAFDHHSAIRSILKTPLYVGQITWKGESYDGKHEPIISRELWDAAQKRMNEEVWIPKNPLQKSPFSNTKLLGGMLYCGHCGARYYAKGNYSGHGDKKVYRPYYTCYSRGKGYKTLIVDPDCKNKSYAVEVLDKIVIDELKHIALDPKALDKLMTDEKGSKRAMERVSELEAERVSIDEQIARMIDLAGLGGMPVKQIAEKIEGLTAQRDRVDIRLREARDAAASASVDSSAALEAFAQVGTVFEHGTFEEQRAVLKNLIEKIVIEEDGSLTFHWRF